MCAYVCIHELCVCAYVCVHELCVCAYVCVHELCVCAYVCVHELCVCAYVWRALLHNNSINYMMIILMGTTIEGRSEMSIYTDNIIAMCLTIPSHFKTSD